MVAPQCRTAGRGRCSGGTPGMATARNSMAAALLLADRMDEAIANLREALRVDPSYLNARYNLARALAAKGDLDGAAGEYTTFVKERPDDGEAQAALGGILLDR